MQGTKRALAGVPDTDIFTSEQRYRFDLQGFIVLRGVLTPEEVASANAAIDAQTSEFVERASSIRNTSGDSSFAHQAAASNDYRGRLENGTFLFWPQEQSQVFRKMLSHPKVTPALNTLLGAGHRLDHMPLILRQRHLTEGFDLHGGRIGVTGKYNEEVAYRFENNGPRCSLLVRCA